jgi:hypothetical protein
MISTSGTLISYMASQGLLNSSNLSTLSDGSLTSTALNSLMGTSTSSTTDTADSTISEASLQWAASRFQSASAIQALNESQQALADELRAAMTKAGVTLSGEVQFAVSSDGSVEVTGDEKDTAAVQAFLKTDTSDPSFASRIATQAQTAVTLSNTIQQSAAISQAAKSAGSSGSNLLSLYTSLMQQKPTTTVVFSISESSSSLSYPGSLTTKA